MPDHRVEPGANLRLQEVPTSARDFGIRKGEAEDEVKELGKELSELQTRLFAEGRQKLLVVLQAMDAGGKDGTIRTVFEPVNPQGVQVTSFKVPSAEELSRDYLWRVHKAVPGKGMIGIFNRSHYEDVLVVRVEKIVPPEVWQLRYDHLNAFEKLLAETGTRILKFYLHISKEEQKERFQERLQEPSKNWKFSLGDLAKRELWDQYMEAYEDVLNRCSTPWAPWYAIPADQKWYRNLVITRVLVQTLRDMNPQFPKPEDLSGVTIV